ncbi:MAG: ABC transporter permease [Sedimentisphaerales bacterium]|nr:ABC transporter permease [Sedimentisphaerales bacterium]
MFLFSGLYHTGVLVVQSILLALSQIWSNKARSVLTTIGIIIGVASVAVVIAALSGMKAKVLKEFEQVGTNTIWCGPHWPDTGPLKDASWMRIRFSPETFEGLLDKCPSIERFTPQMWRREKVSYSNTQLDDVTIKGGNPNLVIIENRELLHGRAISVIDESQKRNVCLINETLQKDLKLPDNCELEVIDIGGKSFSIVGVMKDKASVFDGGVSKEVYLPFSTAWKIWSPWIDLVLQCKRPQLSQEAQAELRFFMRNAKKVRPGDPDPFRINAVEDALKQFNKIAVMVTLIASCVVGISLLVGGVGIMNIMLVSVSERTREIGLRKAVGARPAAIMFQFLIEAVVLCLVGGMVGIGLGQLLTMAISRIPNAQMEEAFIPMWAIMLSFGFSAFIGVFFGLLPAVKAARLDPIVALRHE